MLYNVFIKGGIAIDVKEYNANCVPCSESTNLDYNEKRVVKLTLPFDISIESNPQVQLDKIKKYINLNHIL